MNESNINVSIIISVHNAKRTIRTTLQSVFASTLKHFEVIVIDDASTDGTRDICQEFPIRTIQLTKNCGPAVGRNTGVRESRGEVILFLDSDITFDPDLLERMITYMDKDPTLAGVGSFSSPIPLNPSFFAKYFAIQDHFSTIAWRLGKKERARHQSIYTRCGSITRKVFDEVGGFNEEYKKPSIEDYEFSTRMKDEHGVLYDKSLVNRHHFPETMSKIFSRYHRNTQEMFQLVIKRKIKKRGRFEDDAKVRLLIGISVMLLFFGFIQPPLIFCSLLLFLVAIMMRRKLLHFFYLNGGGVFMLKAWLCYCLLSVPVATGLAYGIIGFFKQNLFMISLKDILVKRK